MKKSRIMDLLLAVLYKAVLDLSFLWLVLPLHGYEVQYANYGAENFEKIICGYVVACLCMGLFWSISKLAVVSRFIIFIQLILIVMPYASLYGTKDLPTWHLGLLLLGYVTTIFSIKSIRAIRFRPPGALTRYALVGVVALIVIYVYAGLVAKGGLSRLNFNFVNVYDVRADYEKNMLPGFGYFISWTAYIFNMALLVVLMRSRRKYGVLSIMAIAVVFFMQVMIFGMTNFKAFLFVPFAVVGLIALSSRMEVQRAALIGAPVIVVCMALINMAGITFGAALLDRMFFIPASMHSLYFDYFSIHPLALMGGTGLGNLLGSSYNESSVFVIANEYWGTMFSPNVGWVGDAYANFGLFGIIVCGMVLALFLRIADGLVGDFVNPGIVEGLMVGPALALCSSGVGTTLFTHGYIAALVVLWALRGYWRKENGVAQQGRRTERGHVDQALLIARLDNR